MFLQLLSLDHPHKILQTRERNKNIFLTVRQRERDLNDVGIAALQSQLLLQELSLRRRWGRERDGGQSSGTNSGLAALLLAGGHLVVSNWGRLGGHVPASIKPDSQVLLQSNWTLTSAVWKCGDSSYGRTHTPAMPTQTAHWAKRKILNVTFFGGNFLWLTCVCE